MLADVIIFKKGGVCMLKQSLIANTNSVADKKQIYVGDNYRITVLTDKLIRFESSQNGEFVDLASFAVWFRLPVYSR